MLGVLVVGWALSRRDKKMASLRYLLQTDDLLAEVFNAYLNSPVSHFSCTFESMSTNGVSLLREQVFSVKLHYAGGSRDFLYDKEFNGDGDEIWTEDKLAVNLMDWTGTHRLPFFIRSKYYSEYRFCRQLEIEGCAEWAEPFTVSVSQAPLFEELSFCFSFLSVLAVQKVL